MDTYQPLSLIAELKAMQAATETLSELPLELPIREIERLPELFQPRGEREDENHLSELIRGIKVHGVLDPVEVIQIGNTAYLIDGHHRITAYGMAKVSEPVPVVYFKGTVEEAVLKAGQANNKTKLPMTTRERMDYAWRLVRMNLYSKSQIVAASGVADRQIGIMRKVVKVLGDEAKELDRWTEALRRSNNKEGHEMSEEERADWVEQRAEQVAGLMARTFSTRLTDNLEITARAFERYFGRRLDELAGEMGFYPRKHEDDLEEDF